MPKPSLTTLLMCAFLTVPAFSQTAELSGLISDPSGLPVPNAAINIQSHSTGAERRLLSNQHGFYSVPALAPGFYDITIEARGFKSTHQTGIVLEVNGRANLDFALSIGNANETVTVNGSVPLLNTSDASVSTVIGNQFVENLPLNGRSFSSLIDLTPGVVLTPATLYEQGQFSVNGQRPDANYFMVDGVSANLGSAGGGSTLLQGGSGQLPATSAFGGTSNLVSLDALEEFRIETSTFAPEYGRTPGAQISVVTKSGTNEFHGTAFEYFRNDKLDANDWFANQHRLARPELRQNDFGGDLGGPMKEDKLFFFGSYEGLRVRQPQVANTYVPSLASRANAPAVVQPLLNAFPLPNGPDLGNGDAGFTAGYSDPSSLNSYGIRFDYLLSSKVTLFGRYNDVPSYLDQRDGGPRQTNYSSLFNIHYRTQTLTLGSDQAITPRLTNEFRFNYSRSRAHAVTTLDDFGGAVVPPNSVLFPSFASPQTALFEFLGDLNPYGLRLLDGEFGNNLVQQFNSTDNLSWALGAHQVKAGIDYRRITPTAGLFPYEAEYLFGSLANVLANKLTAAFIASRAANVQLAFSNWSLFAQDTWKATRALTITYGLRWEYNTAPSALGGPAPVAVTQVNNLATMTLAPSGTPLWHPQKDDFAPRLGLAWQVQPTLVFRAGAGVFYDLGYSAIANTANAFPYTASKSTLGTSFPISSAAAAPPALSAALPTSSYIVAMDPNHVLPRTYEWNAALEKSFGRADVVTASYVGAAGRQLMRYDIYLDPNPNFLGEFDIYRNGTSSSYQSLQTQLRHRFTHGLQALLSYTWAHAIDNVSSDGNFTNVAPGASLLSDRGSSTYDIRHTLAGSISYNIPSPCSGFCQAVLGSWSSDSIIYARSAPPVNVVTGLAAFDAALSGANSVQRPNLNAGVPAWISNPNVAGGKQTNSAAFSKPTGAIQGDLGRNALNGFGATEVDLTLRRQFRIRERLSLQARGDFFNIFNHPNFGSPIAYLSSPQFGQSTQMLGASLGSGGQNGGLNPLYQIGGPRSVQLALKLLF